MSILGSLGSALKGAVGGFLSTGSVVGASQGAIAGAQNVAKGKGKRGLQYQQQFGVLPPSLVTQSRSLVGLPSSNVYSASPVVAGGGFGGSGATGTYGRSTAVALRGGAAGGLKANGMPRKRYRSMNVMNLRAARRAIRRIKGARKILQQIERQLPKQRVHSRPSTRARKWG